MVTWWRWWYDVFNDDDEDYDDDDDEDEDDDDGDGDNEILEIYPSSSVCFQSFILNPRQDRTTDAMQFMISFGYSCLLPASYIVAVSLFG